MTSRLNRLSVIDRATLVTLIFATSTVLFPYSADASTEIKTDFVFEIKSVNTIKIPNTEIVAKLINPDKDTVAHTNNIPKPIVIPVPTVAVIPAGGHKIPPKAVNKVYMHEPEIRAYLCPKLPSVDVCNTFLAVLKGENGTHECTRDNRGLNRNGSIDIGLAQINWNPYSKYSFEQLQDCKFNLDVALSMYQRRGLQPWYAYTKGSYLKHLPSVIAAAAVVTPTEPIAQID
jgi:hypothetical protein